MRLRTQARKSVDAVLQPFLNHGHLYLGEEVRELQHALQTARFAQQDQGPSHLVVAWLLHDIGQLLTFDSQQLHPEENELNGYHEKVGAGFLAQHFNDDVVKPVRLHVAAKRYKISTDLSYQQSLSAASRQSFELQGGLMDESTCRAFESSPWFADALLVRKYDELGKQRNLDVPNLDHYYELLIQHTRVVTERTENA